MKDKYLDKYGIDSLKHLELASINNCEIFLTLNEEILKDRKELEAKYNIKIRKPSEITEQC